MSDQFGSEASDGPSALRSTAEHTTPTVTRTHELKCWPDFFEPILEGRKTFELRRDDRGFREGDLLLLREFDPARVVIDPDTQVETFGAYTGREIARRVGFILPYSERWFGFRIEQGYVVMSLLDAIHPEWEVW